MTRSLFGQNRPSHNTPNNTHTCGPRPGPSTSSGRASSGWFGHLCAWRTGLGAKSALSVSYLKWHPSTNGCGDAQSGTVSPIQALLASMTFGLCSCSSLHLSSTSLHQGLQFYLPKGHGGTQISHGFHLVDICFCLSHQGIHAPKRPAPQDTLACPLKAIKPILPFDRKSFAAGGGIHRIGACVATCGAW